jgi:hypothetical protein
MVIAIKLTKKHNAFLCKPPYKFYNFSIADSPTSMNSCPDMPSALVLASSRDSSFVGVEIARDLGRLVLRKVETAGIQNQI